MADLDDFFAKKDRKKGKSAKKFTTTEEVAKKLEDTAKKTEKQKKDRVPESEENVTQPNEQDEWKEFEEEKKDYSGLKIGNLNIGANQENSNQGQESGSGDQQDIGETGSESERKTGPWKRIEAQSEGAWASQPEEQSRPVAAAAPAPERSGEGSAPTKYKPPSLRSGMSQSSAPMQGRLRGNRYPTLDVNNEEYFPKLSKSGENKKNRSAGAFEVVQPGRNSSYRQQNDQPRNSALHLGNRFTSLSGNDS